MDNTLIIILLSFICGFGIFYTLFISRKTNNDKADKADEALGEIQSIKKDIESISESLTSFNIVQNKIENTLVRGGAVQQGPWGEYVLQNILDDLGFRKGHEYSTQETFSDFDGISKQPDVILHMPRNRHIIVDSKTVLTSWHDYCNAEKKDRSILLKNFINSIKSRLRDLASKNYSQEYGINTVDRVFMFIPIESSFLTIMNDQTIINEIKNKKINIVSPSTLFMMLKLIENLWDIDKQSKDLQEIRLSATNIYDKAINVYESFDSAYKSLNNAMIKMDQAKGRLQDGKGSLVDKLENFKNLNKLKPNKSFPNQSSDDKQIEK